MASSEQEKLQPTAGFGDLQDQINGDAPVSTPEGERPKFNYLVGFRFWLLAFAQMMAVFLVHLEVPIVSTSLVAITDDLGGFDRVTWIVASYLLGYVGFLVIFAKFSDIFGRKFVFSLCLGIFVVFSGLCGAAQTTIQLIIFRAFQGMGGGGTFSLSTIIITEIVPPASYPKYTANLSMAIALSLLLGPIIGGAISAGTTWRWVFLIAVPLGAIAFLAACIGMPWDFPYQGQPNHQPTSTRKFFSKAVLKRVDVLGTILVLLATLSLTAGFEEAGSQFPWKSPYVITLLTVSGLLCIGLITWERSVTLANRTMEPVLPWRFLTNHRMVGLLLVLGLVGPSIIVSTVQIPQRYQLVYGLSPLDAGVRLVPFSIFTAVGTMVASGVAGKLKVPPIFLIIFGACLQIVGFALLGTLPLSLELPSQMYGFEVLAAFGSGMSYIMTYLLIPYTAESRDTAVGMGAGAQFRMMGTAIVLAIATSVFNSYTKPKLESILVDAGDSNFLLSLGRYLNGLPLETQAAIKPVLAEGYNRQMIVLCICAVLQIPAALLMWQRKPIRV